jgi:dihydroorotate dehydrogenase electron transfer subunit
LRVTAAFGFREFRAARAAGAFAIERLWVATEDGSVGRRGTVVDILAGLDVSPQTVVYACGPSAMIAAVQRWSLAEGLRGYASLEAHMACGSGSCHGCVIETARGKLRVCSEGPVFALDEVRP